MSHTPPSLPSASIVGIRRAGAALRCLGSRVPVRQRYGGPTPIMRLCKWTSSPWVRRRQRGACFHAEFNGLKGHCVFGVLRYTRAGEVTCLGGRSSVVVWTCEGARGSLLTPDTIAKAEAERGPSCKKKQTQSPGTPAQTHESPLQKMLSSGLLAMYHHATY